MGEIDEIKEFIGYRLNRVARSKLQERRTSFGVRRCTPNSIVVCGPVSLTQEGFEMEIVIIVLAVMLVALIAYISTQAMRHVGIKEKYFNGMISYGLNIFA